MWREKLAKFFCLMPLTGREPIWTKWQKKQTPDGFIPTSTNYGVILTPEFLVVDVDPRNGGDVSIKELLKNLGIELSRTFTVQTGRGGYHYYFSKPADQKTKIKLLGFGGIEFLSVGHYVVGPESIHPMNLVEYKVVDDADGSIADIPPQLLDALKKEEVTKLAAPLRVLTDEELAVEIDWYRDYVAMQPVPDTGTWNNCCFVIAAEGKDHGLDPETVYEVMHQWNKTTGRAQKDDELRVIVNSAFTNSIQPAGSKAISTMFPAKNPEPTALNEEWGPDVAEQHIAAGWDQDQKGKPAKTMLNVMNYMAIPQYGLVDLLQFNKMSNEIEFVRCPPWHTKLDREVYGGIPTWKDHDTVRFKAFLAKKFGFSPPLQEIEHAILVMAYQRPYHPIRAYFDQLRPPDLSESLLDTWLTRFCGAEDNAYTRAVGAKTLLAAVTRVYKPGEKKDEMLILEGNQRIGKSRLCEVLGGPWHRDIKLDLKDERKSVEVMRGGLIWELSELVGFSKFDEEKIEALKRFLALRSDRVRFSYDRRESNVLRQGIFLGTMNIKRAGYLRDTTGNRRFWPVRCGEKIDVDGFKAVIDKIWAEAVYRFKQCEQLHLSEELEAMAAIEVARREAVHPWTGIVLAGIETLEDEFITADMIWERVLFGNRAQYHETTHNAIVDIMRHAKGWKGKTSYRKDRKTVEHGYVKIKEGEVK